MTYEPLRIVIAGGGTGGHVQPAVAVLEALRAAGSTDALWLGSAGGLERAAAREAGISFRAIQTGKLRRYVSLRTPIDAARIPIGVAQAYRALRDVRPHVVFSTGGFVSVPAVIAARALRIPTLTHEQTATLGLATRINARFCDVVALSYDASRDALPTGRFTVVVTGNPVRPALFNGDAKKAFTTLGFDPALPLVYVTGGALGAHAINQAVEQALPDLTRFAQVMHQCGPASGNGDAPRLRAARERLPEGQRQRYVVEEFVGAELPDIYAAASLVVGRAGAGTTAELAALGKPSILIPLPGAGGDEQTRNARVLERAGASVILPQTELTAERLTAAIDALLQGDRLEAMERAAASCVRRDAAENLARALLDLAGRPIPAGISSLSPPPRSPR